MESKIPIELRVDVYPDEHPQTCFTWGIVVCGRFSPNEKFSKIESLCGNYGRTFSFGDDFVRAYDKWYKKIKSFCDYQKGKIKRQIIYQLQ